MGTDARPAGFATTALVSDAIASLSPYVPGPPLEVVAERLGISVEEVLPLHANENLLGPSSAAQEAAIAAIRRGHLYPDGGGTALRTAIGQRHGVSAEHVVLGSGSNELIDLLIRTFVGEGETIVTAWPSFAVYRLAAQAAGREVLEAPLRQHRYDLPALAALMDRRTKMVFVANPNNPTGTYVPRKSIAAFLRRIPESVIVVLDEAYAEYALPEDYPDGVRCFLHRPRTVVLRTFSKAFGLAALRIGYGIMEPTLAQYLDRVRQPYNVSQVSQAAALGALSDMEHVRASQRMARDSLEYLGQSMAALELAVVDSVANFIMVRVDALTPGEEGAAAAVSQKLLAKGILVRDMTSYGMPEWIRVTAAPRPMMERLVQAIEEMAASAAGQGA